LYRIDRALSSIPSDALAGDWISLEGSRWSATSALAHAKEGNMNAPNVTVIPTRRKDKYFGGIA
jgi:hypothetical protein